MKTIATLIFSASVLLLAGCSGGENTKYAEAANTTALPNQTTQPATAAANPPHGEPNHRCDIPVGAPLNTPLQPNLKSAAPQFNPQTKGAVVPGTNPPHGEPGHDCAIPVGAPLNK